MKTFALLSIALLGGLVACTVPAPSINLPIRTEVVFDHPEKFTDVKDSFSATDKGTASILDNLRTYLVDDADHILPIGYHLKLVFTDIDLAGDFEPWRGGGQWSDVRIVKDIYPPAFKFTYTFTDDAGAVVKQGSEDIRDLTFQSRLVQPIEDPLRYEKSILDEWIRTHVSDLKKG